MTSGNKAREYVQRLLSNGMLEQKPIWKLKDDGDSWYMERLDNPDFVRPTQSGNAKGILRHYSLKQNTRDLYMDAEYLPRFISNYPVE